MDNIIKKINELIKEPMDEMNITIDSIIWEIIGKNKYLRITLDRSDGLDMNTIVDATNIINPILDEADLIDEQYILEVSSKERG